MVGCCRFLVKPRAPSLLSIMGGGKKKAQRFYRLRQARKEGDADGVTAAASGADAASGEAGSQGEHKSHEHHHHHHRDHEQAARHLYERPAQKNERWETYYRGQALCQDEEDWNAFVRTCRRPLPTTFRFSGPQRCV
jgi:hypothetical protein